MWNKKQFSSFLKGFQLPKIVSDLRVECTFKGCVHYICALLSLNKSTFSIHIFWKFDQLK